MATKKYMLLVAALSLALFGLTALLNRVVDPFWYYRDISIEGFNAVKTKFRYYERHVKPSVVQREQPASLIFGSSFAEIGLDPQHRALTRAGGSYNFGMGGAGWDMVACHVQFALTHDAALRQIVLGIHPQAMPLKNCAADIARMERPDEKAFLLSRDALEKSISTVLEQRKRKPSHTREGLYFYSRGEPGVESRFREYLTNHVACKLEHKLGVQPRPAPAAVQAHSALDLSGLRDILEKAAARGIAVRLLLYPRHALLVEQEYQCGKRQERWDAMRQIAALVVRSPQSQVEMWDFEGYHEFGTEAISNAPAIYWQDPAHFNHEFGSIMLDEMFALRPAKSGARLTSDSVAARAEAERKARTDYLDNHPELLKQLESLLPRHADRI